MGIIAWIDMETSGLDTRTTDVLEVAIIITSASFTPIARKNWIICPPNWPEVRGNLPEVVFEMHNANNLIADLDAMHAAGEAGERLQTLYEAETEMVEFIMSKRPGGGKVPMGGSGVANFDRHIVRDQMPRLNELMPYYTLDVGIQRRIGNTVNIAAPAEASDGAVKTHRAMDDTEMHLAEGRWWRSFLLECRRAGIRGLDTSAWGSHDEVDDALSTVQAAFQDETGGGTNADFLSWYADRSNAAEAKS